MDIFIPLFIIVLNTIVKSWNQLRCLKTDEWIMKLWDLYTIEYYTAIWYDAIMRFTTRRELEDL